MPSHSQLHDLESRLLWCRGWYVLRLWQECGTAESATDFDRFQIAEELLADSAGRTKEWASIGRAKLIDHLLVKVDHPDAEVRQEAAIALGDFCSKDH